jgi:protein-tyrosine phosphatase
MEKQATAILFVCMGNICRSPSAKGFFDLHCQKHGLQDHYYSESAGTHGWHVGQPPDPRSIAAAAAWDIDISEDLSRRVSASDFERFSYIVAMDQSNLENLQAFNPATGTADLTLLLPFSTSLGYTDVPDPYFGGAGGFDDICSLLNTACSDFLQHLEDQRIKSISE